MARGKSKGDVFLCVKDRFGVGGTLGVGGKSLFLTFLPGVTIAVYFFPARQKKRFCDEQKLIVKEFLLWTVVACRECFSGVIY
jgi:hypothetical protein